MQVNFKAIAVSNFLIHQRSTQIRSCNTAALCQLLQNRFSCIDRNSKANAFNTAYSNLSTVNAYYLAVSIYQSTATVTGVDCRISLNQVELALAYFNAAVQCTDNACGYTAAEFQSQRVADSNCRFSDLQCIAVTKGGNGKVIRINFYYSQIGYSIGTQYLAFNGTSVRQADDDFRCTLNYVVVGCNIAVLVINNAAACTTLHQLRAVEEVAHISLVGDTYDSRTNLLGGSYNRCIACRTQLLLSLGSRLFMYCGGGFIVAAAGNKNCRTQKATDKNIS